MDGRAVTTAAGLAPRDELHPAQESLVEHFGFQCGFCTAGMAVTASTLDAGDLPDLDRRMKGNLCRCTGYRAIRESITASVLGPVRDTAPSARGVGQSVHPPAAQRRRAGPRALHVRHRPHRSAHAARAVEPARPRAHHRDRHDRGRAARRGRRGVHAPRCSRAPLFDRTARACDRRLRRHPPARRRRAPRRPARRRGRRRDGRDRRGRVPAHPRRLRDPPRRLRPRARPHPGRAGHPSGTHARRPGGAGRAQRDPVDPRGLRRRRGGPGRERGDRQRRVAHLAREPCAARDARVDRLARRRRAGS